LTTGDFPQSSTAPITRVKGNVFAHGNFSKPFAGGIQMRSNLVEFFKLPEVPSASAGRFRPPTDTGPLWALLGYLALHAVEPYAQRPTGPIAPSGLRTAAPSSARGTPNLTKPPGPDESAANVTSGAPPISAERRALVDRARKEWIDRLIDPSRNNNLLFFRPLKLATLDLSDAGPEVSGALIRGETISLDRLVAPEREVQAVAQAKEIRKRAIANLEDRGLETLYLAYGMASWPANDDGRPPTAPILLVPIELELRGREGRQINVRRKGDVQVNLVLLHFLEQAGCRLQPEDLFDAAKVGDDFEPNEVLGRLAHSAAGVKGLTTSPRMILGNFSFQKMALVKDLREREDQFAAHDLIAAIAGDIDAREKAVARRSDSSLTIDLDEVPANDEHVVRDADASQQRAIVATLSGRDGIIDGPPGTGKSQTIANLIACLAARGRRVLFVAEKRAALEVVQRRLDEVGLAHLTLDLHGADLTRARVMASFAESLKHLRTIGPVDPAVIHRDFEDRRARLNEHVRRMTARRPPSQLSAYEIQVRLLAIPAEARMTTRWRRPDIDTLTADVAERIRLRLTEAAGFETLFLRSDPSPWTGAELTTAQIVEEVVERAERLAHRHWPSFAAALRDAVQKAGLPYPTSLSDAVSAKQLLEDVAATLDLYSPTVYEFDLDEASRVLAPAAKGFWSAATAWCRDAAFRAWRRQLRSVRRARRAAGKVLYEEACQAAEQKKRWMTRASQLPTSMPDLTTLRSTFGAVVEELPPLTRQLRKSDLDQWPLERLGQFFDSLADDTVTPYRLPALCTIERDLTEQRATPFVEELRGERLPTTLWCPGFDFSWLASCYDRARLEDPALAGFNGVVHDRFVQDFIRLDCERLQLAAMRVNREHAERAVAAMNSHPAQTAIVEREAAKRARHLPVRRLLAEAPDVLTALRPCWMASPLSVSQLVSADRRYFDVVIFDEASQVLPEDAVCSILRADQTIVAGDPRQLPPTPFFAAGGEDDEEATDTFTPVGFESVLDLMSGFLQSPWTLTWHYRSKDEALIAFSNAHIYDWQLITFPGCGGQTSVRLEAIEPLPDHDDRMGSAANEVRRVVELIVAHAAQCPNQSLGVIALGLPHARRIEAALEDALRHRSDLDAFFAVGSGPSDRRFFLKNLERVQGDEADAIILTLGVAKDRTGRVDLRQFGPLNGPHGTRRLNVAITRARRRMVLVSSISHWDLDPARASDGVKLVRHYLEYTASGGARLAKDSATTVEVNAFERSVLDALRSKGIDAEPQWGVSGYRIDLAARHPRRPGRFVLAVECDGASYHSAPTARDRDRLRQQHLEALGWRFHRIWSTDWFLRRDEELSRLVEGYARAVEFADRLDAEDPRQSNASAAEPISRTPSAVDAPSVPLSRGPRPNIPERSLDGRHLDSLVTWIQSDGRLRTDEDLLLEVMEELGFERRGVRIETLIRSAITRAKGKRADIR